MSENPVEGQTKDNTSLLGQDEIDLRPIIDVLVNWSREIIALAVIAFICAGAVLAIQNLMAKPVYEGSAIVAIARVESNVTFDPKFTTDAQQGQTTDARARRAALLGLVPNGAVAETVVKELGDQLSAAERNPGQLLRSVRAVISSQSSNAGASPTTSDLNSDLIQIVARADSPAKAAAIANAWAKAYVDQVNSIYGQASSSVSPSVEAQLTKARTSYQTAESNLQTFLADSKTDELQWQITGLRVQVANAYDAYVSTAQVLNNARALRAQVAGGGETAVASNAMALQLLKVQAFTQLSGNRPSSELGRQAVSTSTTDQHDNQTPTEPAATQPQLQLQVPALPQLNAASMLADLDGLIRALENRQRDLGIQISAEAQALLPHDASITNASQPVDASNPSLTDTISSLQLQLRQLNARLEADSARKQQLTQERDLAWNTYTTLSSKVAELSVAQAAANSEVRFAAPALPPVQPVARRNPLIPAVTAGVIGLVLAAGAALLANYLGQQPLFSHSPRKQPKLQAEV